MTHCIGRSSLQMSQVDHQAGAYPSVHIMRRLGVFLLPLDGMLVHPRVTSNIKFAGTHLYTWVSEETHCESKVSYPRTQHNVPGQDQTCTAQTGDERINHEATVPPHIMHRTVNKINVLTKDVQTCNVYNAQTGSFPQF